MSEEIRGMDVELPKPQPVRHTRRFSEAELVAAIKQYLRSGGAYVPGGPAYLYGLERGPGEPCVTLVIEEAI